MIWYGMYFPLTHVVDLTRTLKGRHPRDPLVGKQLSTGLDAVNDIDVVEDTGLDDSHAVDTAETVAVAEQSGATVGAEPAGNGLATVGCLADLFGLAACDAKVGRWNYNVVAVVAAADFPAVTAVAEGLGLHRKC